MADRITKKQRSLNMSAVHCRGNFTTELALAELLRRAQVTGWRRNRKISGIRPDFVFPKRRVAVFVHGCFWHGCEKHRSVPKTRKAFWREKISGNHMRDLRQVRILRRLGWRTLTVWEHQLKKGRDKTLKYLERSIKVATQK